MYIMPHQPWRKNTDHPKVYSENFLTPAVSSRMLSSETWKQFSSRWFDQGGQGGRELWGKASGLLRLTVCWERSPRGKICTLLGVEGGSGLWLCLHARLNKGGEQSWAGRAGACYGGWGVESSLQQRGTESGRRLEGQESWKEEVYTETLLSQ